MSNLSKKFFGFEKFFTKKNRRNIRYFSNRSLHYIFFNNFLFILSTFLFLLGVPLQSHPHGDTCATGGDPLPSPPP
jgi:hypothetical protein